MNAGQENFIPHGMCYLWNPQMLALQTLSDAGIVLAYFSIPLILLFFIRKRKDLPFNWAFAMFGLFIVACGLTHAMGIVTIWHSAFWTEGFIKAGTAVVSLATAAMLIPLVPKALAFRSPADLERLNDQLEQDVRARKRCEERLRATERWLRQIESCTPVGLGLLAFNGDFSRVNPALCKLFGYGPEELCTMNFHALALPEDLPSHLALIRQTLEDGSPSYDTETRYVHQSGRIVWVRLNATLVRDDAGGSDYFVAQFQDVTARKDAEQATAAAQEAKLAAAASRAHFLAAVSHEIRTPLNGVIGVAELLSLSHLSSEQGEYVDVLQKSGQSLLRVLNDVLDYSKIDAGKLDLEIVDFNLSSQLDSVVALFKPQFEHKGVSLQTQLDPKVPAALAGDPGRLRQILSNLIGNALKFTVAGGGVSVLVEAVPAEIALCSIRFSIVDTGIGIPPELRHRLFRPFSQVDASTTRRYGGTGLGLSISKDLVDLMGGAIGVSSTLGAGSTFWFTLSLPPARETANPIAKPQSGSTGHLAFVKARHERLLVADDNPINTLLALRQFKQLGFGITIVSDGREAVEAVRTSPYDLVLMDCQMPELDGLEATREIRIMQAETGKRVTIVAMTANAQREDREACLAAGMDDYIAKPVNLDALRDVVARWIPDVSEALEEAGTFDEQRQA